MHDPRLSEFIENYGLMLKIANYFFKPTILQKQFQIGINMFNTLFFNSDITMITTYMHVYPFLSIYIGFITFVDHWALMRQIEVMKGSTNIT